MLQLTVLVWGFTAILGKQITLDAYSLVYYRQLITIVVIVGWMLVRKQSLRVSPRAALQLVGVGALISVHWVCFYACIKLAGVAVAVLCLASVVLVTALVEPPIFGRRVRPVEVAIGLGVLAGVWLLVRVETGAPVSAVLIGLVAAVMGAVFGTLNGKLRQGLPSDVMTAWELGAGALWILLFLALSPDHALVSPADIGLHDWLWLTVMAVVCTALPWIWSLDVLSVLTPYTVALSVTLEPVYSMIIAYFWFPDSERLTLGFYAGSALLIVLVMLNARLRSRAELAAPA